MASSSVLVALGAAVYYAVYFLSKLLPLGMIMV